MNRKTTLLVVIIAVLVIFNAIYIVKNINQNIKFKQIEIKYNAIQKQYTIFAKSVESRIAMETRNGGSDINCQLLDATILDSSLLLRINTKSCQACIENILSVLSKIDRRYAGKIIVVGTFESKTEFKYYKQNLFKEYHVIDLEREYLLDNQLEKSRISYFFTIDEGNRIRNLFIPDKNFPFLTKTYLINILPCID